MCELGYVKYTVAVAFKIPDREGPIVWQGVMFSEVGDMETARKKGLELAKDYIRTEYKDFDYTNALYSSSVSEIPKDGRDWESITKVHLN